MTDNAHIREFLKYYCDLSKEPQYAVLLNGPWGSGKTWFIKEFIAEYLLRRDHVLYISLYGIQSFDDIEAKLFSLLHPLLGSKPVRILGRLAQGALKTSINIDWNNDGKADGSISGGLPTDKLLDRVTLKPSTILIIDDLERCSIPIVDLLGYLNQFVEHGGIKAILISNEAEILKRQSDSGDNYSEIKEKLIGRTFEVVPEFSRALEHFAEDLPTSIAQDVVRANFILIEQIYECSKFRNLRLIRHALWDFARLLQAVEPDAQRSTPLMVDLLTLFLAYSLEVKSGNIKPQELKNLRGIHLIIRDKNESDDIQRFDNIRKKYSGLNLYDSLVQESVWETIFSTGSIPKAELNEALLKSKYFQKDNQPNWVKLWYGMDLPDDEFAVVLGLAEKDWQSRDYRHLGEVIHVTGLFVRFAKNSILNKSVEEIILSAKDYINHLLRDGEIPIPQPNTSLSMFDRESYAGLGFASLEVEEFREFLEYIEERRQEAMISSFPEQAEGLLALIGTDTNLFFRRIILNNDQENIYYKTPILNLLKPTDFIRNLLKVSLEDQKIVGYAFKQRYAFQQFNHDLLPELPWLKQVAKQLQAEAFSRAGKISKLSLELFVIQHITDAISQLELLTPG